jgi:hypothetical protein
MHRRRGSYSPLKGGTFFNVHGLIKAWNTAIAKLNASGRWQPLRNVMVAEKGLAFRNAYHAKSSFHLRRLPFNNGLVYGE